MRATSFAATPPPPYYAVVFSSQRTAEDRGYAAGASRMVQLAAKVAAPGDGADRQLRRPRFVDVFRGGSGADLFLCSRSPSLPP